MFLSLKLLKFSEIKGVKSLARKSGGVKFLTNIMSALLMKKVTKILLGLLLTPILEAKTVMIIVNLVKERMSYSKLLCYISVFSGY